MKKVLIVVLAILSLYVVYKINYPKTEPVSIKVVTNFKLDDYNVFYLDLSEEDITTLNLSKYITNSVDIISVTPYVNPIYKDKIDSMKYAFAPNISYKRNINNFINYYKDTIKNTGYIDDLNYVDVDGIKIMEMEVYARGSDIVNIIYQKKNIKYKTVFKGEYEYLEI
ncbi:MAG: hypothetical protein IJ565_05025 [Bacilli bacterium]|nr:hypothetical protein [Bacilli bacterium]